MTCLSSAVTVLVCSIGVWCVVAPNVESPMVSGEATGGGVDTLVFIVAVDLSSLRCFRFLRSDFPDGVCTTYDFGSIHLCVMTAGDYLLVP